MESVGFDSETDERSIVVEAVGVVDVVDDADAVADGGGSGFVIDDRTLFMRGGCDGKGGGVDAVVGVVVVDVVFAGSVDDLVSPFE